MAVIDLYSKRAKRQRGDLPDVYIYDAIDAPLRIQIVQLFHDTLGDTDDTASSVTDTYAYIVKTLRREYACFALPGTKTSYRTGFERDNCWVQELSNFFLQVTDHERALDVIELVFRAIDKCTRDYRYFGFVDASARADRAIEELNIRFREHGVGYQFVSGEIVRVDSELIHSEVVKPALRLLNRKEYRGAQEEFLKAHEHYRAGNTKEALNECLKSFESTMKTICIKRGWTYEAKSTAKDLISTCLSNKLIPEFWQNQFTALKSLLESSVPTGRNKLSGHGQGAVPTDVPDYLVAYMLHMTASAIVFLAEAESKLS